MKLSLDSNTIQAINLFQNITNCAVVDFIEDENEIYVIVSKGQYGLAVGKKGIKIKQAEKKFKKNIKVFEYSDDLEQFIRNLIPDITEINKNNDCIYIKVSPASRSKVIGKSGRNIKILNKFVKRLFDVDCLKVK